MFTKAEEVQTVDDTLLYRVYTSNSVMAKLYRWNDTTGFSELAIGLPASVLAFEPAGIQKVNGTIWLYGNARFQSGPDGPVVIRPAAAGSVYVQRLFPTFSAGFYVPGAIGSIFTASIKFVGANGRIYGDVYFNSRRVPWTSFAGNTTAQLKSGITVPGAFSDVLGFSAYENKLLGTRMTLNLAVLDSATATSPASPYGNYTSNSTPVFSHCTDSGHLVGKTTSWVTKAPNAGLVPLGLPFTPSSAVTAVDWPSGSSSLSLVGSHAKQSGPQPFLRYNGQSYTFPVLPYAPSWGKALRAHMVPQTPVGGSPNLQSLTPKFLVEGFLQHPGSIPCKYFMVRDYTESGGSLAYLGIEERTQCGFGTITTVKPRFPLHGATTTSKSLVATVEMPGGKMIDVILAGTIDSNGDGMPDDWVTLNALSGDPDEDADGDSLTNLEEFRYDTSPNNQDSDDDGIPDGVEIQNGLSALNISDASEDWDGDHVSNADEINMELSSLGEFQLYTDQNFSSGQHMGLHGANRAGQVLYNTTYGFEIANFSDVLGVPHISRTVLPSGYGVNNTYIEPSGIDDQGSVYGSIWDYLTDDFNNWTSDLYRTFSVRPENGDFTWNVWDDFSLGFWNPLNEYAYQSWHPSASMNWWIAGPGAGGPGSQFHAFRQSWNETWTGLNESYGLLGPAGWHPKLQWDSSQMVVQQIVVGADGSAAMVCHDLDATQISVTPISPEGDILASYSPQDLHPLYAYKLVKLAGSNHLLRMTPDGILWDVHDQVSERHLHSHPPTGPQYDLVSSALNGQVLIHASSPSHASFSFGGQAYTNGTESYLIRNGYTVPLRTIAAKSDLHPARWKQSGNVVSSSGGDVATIYTDRFSGIPWLCYFKNNRDTDNDGLPDDWERFHFGNLLFNGDQDSDGDGKTNLQEFMASTRPRVPAARDVSDPDQPAAAAADTVPRIFLMKSKRWAKYKHERRIEPGQQDYPSDSGSSSSYDASNGLYYGLPCRPGKGELVIFKNFPNGQNSRAYENRYLTNRIPFINMTSDPCDNSYLGIGTVLQNNAMFPEEPTEYMEMLGEEIPLNATDNTTGQSKSTYREEIYYDATGNQKTRVIINWEADMEQARYWLCSNYTVTDAVSHTAHFLVTRKGTEVETSAEPYGQTHLVSHTLEIPAGQNRSAPLDIQPNFFPSGIKGADFTVDFSANSQVRHKDERYSVLLSSLNARVDANRDGLIEFNGRDKTTQDSPYQFWINDDRDGEGSVDLDDSDEYEEWEEARWEQDDFEVSGIMDYGDGEIQLARDLEDFARLWVDLRGLKELAYAASVDLNELEMVVRCEEVTDFPKINLYLSADPTGGLDYVKVDTNPPNSNTEGSTNPHLGEPFRNVVSSLHYYNTSGVVIPSWVWNNVDEPNELHFLFEGGGTGKMNVVFELRRNGQVFASFNRIHLQLSKVEDMYETYTVGDNIDGGIQYSSWPAASATQVGGQSLPPPESEEERDYILFVHGWNMPLWEKTAFANTMFKRLWHLGYKGRFGFFRWPTFWFDEHTGSIQVPVIGDVPNPAHFDASEQRAWHSAAGLQTLIQTLSNTYSANGESKLRIYAHSMGNIAVCEALRKFGGNAPVHTYVASKAAMSSHMFDPTTADMPYTALSGVVPPNVYGYYWHPSSITGPANWEAEGRDCYMHPGYMPTNVRYRNHYNPYDWALGYTKWQMTQRLKPDAGYNFNVQFYRGISTPLLFPHDRYEIFAWAAQSHGYALGQMGDTDGVFNTKKKMVSGPPYHFGKSHKYHSGHFRSTIQKRWMYWKDTVLDDMEINLP